MSFDLGFWWEERPLSSTDAARKYEALIEGRTGIVTGHSKLESLYDTIVSRFPDLTEENLDSSPWSVPLHKTRECIIVTMSYSRQSEVSDILLQMSESFGITCYDPQTGKVYFPEGESTATLELASGLVIRGPSQDDVIAALSEISSEDWYVVLERRPGWFIQVGFGEVAGVSDGSHALEVREGSEENHFRAVIEERSRVIDIFCRYLSGNAGWMRDSDFSRVIV